MSRLKKAALALVLIVVACDGSSEPVTSTGEGGPDTTREETSTTTAASTTSTSLITTTTKSIDAIDLPLAQPDSPEWNILYSIPVGSDGVTYEGGFEDWMLSGPQALAVAPDGSLWIADTNGRRLLHFAEDGALLAHIDTDPMDVAGLIDVAAVDDGIWGLEVLPAINRHRIVLFGDGGEVVDSHDLPSGLHLRDGLWGIAAAPDGQVWIELEGGARVYTAFDPDGEFNPELARGYEVQGAILHPAGIEDGMAQFVVGDVTVRRPVREQGGINFEGTVPGWVALLVSDVAFDEGGALTVDLEILYTDLRGNITATATYPLDEVAAEAYVAQDFIAVAPDGRLIAMKPTPDSLDVIELSLFAAGDDR